MTPDILSARLDAFRVGFLRELAITYDAIEERDINLKTVASKRKKAASRLDWDVVKVDGADETEAEKHRVALRFFYENLKATSVMESNQRGGVALLIRQMMDAIGKRYAVHEIVWKPVARELRIADYGLQIDGKAALANGPSGLALSPKARELRIADYGLQIDGKAALANGPSGLALNPKVALTQRPAVREAVDSQGTAVARSFQTGSGTPNASRGSQGNSNSNAPVEGNAAAPGGAVALPALQALLTAEFRFCPLWFFENRTGRLRFIPTPFGVEGVEMADGDWMVTVGDGIMEACAVAYIFKQMSLKDWVAFSEKFGLPGVLGKTDAQKGSDQWNAMSDAVTALMNDWAAVMSKSDDITLLEPKNGAANLPFPPLVEYMDRKMAAIWRGADLSTISQGKESSGASLQGDESDLLTEDDAEMVTETLNQQVDTFVIEYLFGPGTEPKAYFKLGTGREEAEDAKFRRDVFMKFLDDGTTVDMMANLTDLRELTRGVGLPPNEEYIEPYLPVKDAQGNAVTGDVVRDPEGDVVGGSSTGANRGNGGNGDLKGTNALANSNDPAQLASQLEENALPDFVQAVAHDLRPLVQRLGGILEIVDDQVRAEKLTAFMRELPRFKKDILTDTDAGKVLQWTISAALLNGFSQRGPVAALGAKTERTS